MTEATPPLNKTPEASRKLTHAEYHLSQIRSENVKVVRKDRVAIEASVSGCLGAIKSALYRLKKEVGRERYNEKLSQWKGTLDKAERHRWNLMGKLRDLDVHEADIETSVRQSAIPAHQVPGIRVFTAPGGEVPNPDPGGSPAFASGWYFSQEVYVEANEASKACEEFLRLAKRFVGEFQ